MIEHRLFFALPSLSRSYVLLSLTDRGSFATDSAPKFSRVAALKSIYLPGSSCHRELANSSQQGMLRNSVALRFGIEVQMVAFVPSKAENMGFRSCGLSQLRLRGGCLYA